MSINSNVRTFHKLLESHNCNLIAVSKTHPIPAIQEAYEAGQRDFGENKVQELVEKQPNLPSDIQWHLIGHLQRNKVKYISSFVYMIHSVDSEKLLKEIEKQAKKENRTIRCLLQVHIADEDTKFGISEHELETLFKNDTLLNLSNVKIMGLMGMATFTEDEEKIRSEFKKLKKIFDNLKMQKLPSHIEMKELSMGMSSDYKIAIEEGSTMIRVGSAVFGNRDYSN